ncbi:MAG: amino acid ABC transporter substrate-binding protein [Mesorhizobium sp.]
MPTARDGMRPTPRETTFESSYNRAHDEGSHISGRLHSALGFLQKAFIAAALLTAGVAGAQAGETLNQVRARGSLICGVNTGFPGFAVPDAQGEWRGFDTDLCRGLATILFNDPTKVRFVPLTTVTRFTALQSGEIDVLIRQTTLTLTRDTNLGLRVTHPYFYDGHGFMVRRDANITDPKQMDGMTICLVPSSTGETSTADWFRANGLQFTPLLIEKSQDFSAAFQAGRCDALGNDATALASQRTRFAQPENYVILDQRFSKEPYGPVVRRNDQEWFEIVRWMVMAVIQAEELGITQANAEEMRKTSQNAEVQRLLGVDPILGEALKLDPDWAYNMIRAIGNYGELFERNLGPKTPVGLSRGVNSLWTDGGLMYSWPMR